MTRSSSVELRGGRAPQLRNVPAYVATAGPEAVALARSCGLELDPWQQDVLTDALGEREDGTWAAFRVGVIVSRQNGKGSILEARVLAGLTLFDERLIMWTAHEMKTALEAMRRVEALIDASPDLKRRVRSISRANGNEGIVFRNGARLRFVARSKGSGRGFTGDCVILDEAYALTPEQLAALLPTLSAVPNPQIWFTSSPPLDPVNGEVLFRLRDNAMDGDLRLAYFDWGVQGVDLDGLSQIDLSDSALWARCNPAFGYRISEEFTGQEFGSMPPVEFARERLGVWPARNAGASVISTEQWEALADPDSHRDGGVAIALDVTPDRSRAAIAVAGLRADGLMHWELIEHRPGTDWVVKRVAALKARHNPVAIAVDGKGPAASLITDLNKAGITESEDRDEPRPGDLVVTSAQDMANAFGMLVDAVRQDAARHRDQAPLNAALAGAKTRALGDGGEAWGRKGSADISPLVAVTLAHWAYETRAHLLVDDGPPNIW